MKPLNNLEKGRLLADLFPEQLENICKEVLKQAEYFLENEEHIRAHWAGSIVTDNFWYSLVQNAVRRTKECGNRLYKNHRWFSDQLFDGYDAVFTIYCLVVYATKAECNYRLRYCIYLLFGEEKLLDLTQKENNHG